MRQQRNTDLNGMVLEGSERNVNEWQVLHYASTDEGVIMDYVSRRKLSGASYQLELTHEEIAELHRLSIQRQRIRYLVENE